MRIVLVANPRSGRARNTAAIAELQERLAADGLRVTCLSPASPALADSLRTADALVIAGGDGSVHHAAGPALAADVPIYHFPLGTENLFARGMGATRSVDQLVRALRSGHTTPIDVGMCNQRPFLLMCSIGFDAHVVQRVAAARSSAGVARSDYLSRGLAELREFRMPPLRVQIGDHALVRDEPGLLIIANSPHYAARLNPCADARWDDGLLDVAFFPYRSRAGLLAWLASVATGIHLDRATIRRARAASVLVSSTEPDVAYQLDGEAVTDHGPLGLTVDVADNRLRVLVA